MSDAQQAYSTVLADLRARIADHQKQIDSLNTAIQVITLAAPSSTNGAAVPPSNTTARFYGMSYRKAILAFLASNPYNAYDTGLVSQALQQGGMTTSGISFTSNVSATLSDMAKKYGEVERVNGTAWRLTAKGYAAALGLVSDNPDNASLSSLELSPLYDATLQTLPSEQ